VSPFLFLVITVWTINEEVSLLLEVECRIFCEKRGFLSLPALLVMGKNFVLKMAYDPDLESQKKLGVIYNQRQTGHPQKA
jgi:hypothetical protein